MAEEINISSSTKEERYQELLPQIEALIKGESDVIANLANVCAALKYGMNFFWVGFYLVEGEQLVLGPFQGPIACTRIHKGKGVCGKAWEKSEVIIVEDVNKFPGHISCSALSKSEIVIPIYNNGDIIAVLDVDSDQYSSFDKTDEVWLTRLTKLLIL
jgi:L-methionine (R)-S-oxide reductase